MQEGLSARRHFSTLAECLQPKFLDDTAGLSMPLPSFYPLRSCANTKAASEEDPPLKMARDNCGEVEAESLTGTAAVKCQLWISNSVPPFFFQGGNSLSSCTVLDKVGEGQFGEKFRARHNVSGLCRTVKRLKKSLESRDHHRNELAALMALDHPHIVRLIEVCDDEHCLHLVEELCNGPHLYQAFIAVSVGSTSGSTSWLWSRIGRPEQFPQ